MVATIREANERIKETASRIPAPRTGGFDSKLTKERIMATSTDVRSV
jgi:hypothetical protein